MLFNHRRVQITFIATFIGFTFLWILIRLNIHSFGLSLLIWLHGFVILRYSFSLLRHHIRLLNILGCCSFKIWGNNRCLFFRWCFGNRWFVVNSMMIRRCWCIALLTIRIIIFPVWSSRLGLLLILFKESFLEVCYELNVI